MTDPRALPRPSGVAYEMGMGEIGPVRVGGGWPEFDLRITFTVESDDMEAVMRAARHALDEVYNRAGGRYVAP